MDARSTLSFWKSTLMSACTQRLKRSRDSVRGGSKEALWSGGSPRVGGPAWVQDTAPGCAM